VACGPQDKADTARHWNAALVVAQNALLGMPTWRGSLPALFALKEPSLACKGYKIPSVACWARLQVSASSACAACGRQGVQLPGT
jgi:hypothetical protein